MKKSYHSTLAPRSPVNAGFNEPSVPSMRPPTGHTCGPTGLRYRKSLRREALDQIDEACLQHGLRRMTAVPDDPAPRDHDVANGGASPRKNQMIEGGVRDGAGHAGMRGVEDQPIRTSTHLDGSGRLADRLRAVPRGVAPQSGSHVRVAFVGEHGAALLAQSLLIFHPPQFLGRTDGGLAVGAHAERSAQFQKSGGFEETIAQVR